MTPKSATAMVTPATAADRPNAAIAGCSLVTRRVEALPGGLSDQLKLPLLRSVQLPLPVLVLVGSRNHRGS